MLLSIQFPLADVRKFVPDSGLLKVPTWPLPDLKNFVHYYGRIKRRKGGGVVGWGENEICDSRRAFRFDGTLNFRDAPTGVYLPLGCAFRRFTFDGYAVGKFEVGIASGKQPFVFTRQQTAALVTHFLELPIRVPSPSGETKIRRLSEAGAALAALYAVGTTRRDPAVLAQLQPWWVSDGPPLLFLEYELGQDISPPRGAIAVPIPEKHGLTIFHYSFTHDGQSIPLWLLGHQADATVPVARTLRLYLMRLHAEHECLKKVLQQLMTGNLAPAAGSREEKNLQNYVWEAVKNISGAENRSMQRLGVDIGAVAYEAMSAVTPHEVEGLRRVIVDLGLRTNNQAPNSPPVRQWLRQKLLAVLVDSFNLAELQSLCFKLGVDYDMLAGNEKESKARELIAWFERRGGVSALIEGIRQERPHLSDEFQTDGNPTEVL